jgi:hypothetical protein
MLRHLGIHAAAALVLIASADAQDVTPCSSFDASTGKGVCNGVHVDIGAVICAGGFDKSKCSATRNMEGIGSETYYFKVRHIKCCSFTHDTSHEQPIAPLCFHDFADCLNCADVLTADCHMHCMALDLPCAHVESCGWEAAWPVSRSLMYSLHHALVRRPPRHTFATGHAKGASSWIATSK